MSKGTTSRCPASGHYWATPGVGSNLLFRLQFSLDPQEYEDDAVFRSYIDDEYMGHKWQCVEFALAVFSF